MELFICRNKMDSYGQGYIKRYKIRTESEYIKRLLISAASTGQTKWGASEPKEYGIASTVIYRSILFWKNIHFMALDCDSEDKLIAAARCLYQDDIHFVRIESSPGKFWLITDYMGKFGDVQDKASTIVGADHNHLSLSKDIGFIPIRATPRAEFTLQFLDDGDNLRDPRIQQWYQDFQNLYDKLQIVSYREKLQKHLREGTIQNMAANPEFRV